MTLEDPDPPPPVNDVNPVNKVHEGPILAGCPLPGLPLSGAAVSQSQSLPLFCPQLGIPWSELPHAL